MIPASLIDGRLGSLVVVYNGTPPVIPNQNFDSLFLSKPNNRLFQQDVNMGWFPTTLDSQADGWHFDIVGLLAVIGGSATAKHLPAIAASPFSVIPRLLPAPETLLDTDRTHRLPAISGVKVIGTQSGILLNELNYFATLIHDIESLPRYAVKVCRVSHRRNEPDPRNDEEKTGEASQHELRPIRIQLTSWLNAVTVISILITAALIIAAGVLHDGVAILALAATAGSTSAASLSAKWSPRLGTRTAKVEVPPADVVLATRAGAFVVVNCEETVCRELYAGMDDCDYLFSRVPHRILLAVSTLLLMAGIILFSNCSWKLQIAVGTAYLILNLLYWLLALLVDAREIWDLSRYEWEEKTIPTEQPSFTLALWLAILHAQEVSWVRRGSVAPRSDAWDAWLAAAADNLDNPDWDAVGYKDELMKQEVEKARRKRARLETKQAQPTTRSLTY
ncbi:uncharacterized protein BP01DRAFT_388382 [Aspergillus saccharolyticus JOP 1030-1]|uniref:Uncharacterized protein n=1 Tax=Aspergillus saccharolyticus JOP 1030-1 TaxID=1450539 RepID=A0A319ACF1_9EURO|nr:hypothetical protein BP01DRAFT_388382 [Aspergillus saccharolyticus JOP 1030-1]PYH49328.1 hypothetical protein BP01DRAFT_388382 [Aspergillus saccharolyticus JOP 1030-1]